MQYLCSENEVQWQILGIQQEEGCSFPVVQKFAENLFGCEQTKAVCQYTAEVWTVVFKMVAIHLKCQKAVSDHRSLAP